MKVQAGKSYRTASGNSVAVLQEIGVFFIGAFVAGPDDIRLKLYLPDGAFWGGGEFGQRLYDIESELENDERPVI